MKKITIKFFAISMIVFCNSISCLLAQCTYTLTLQPNGVAGMDAFLSDYSGSQTNLNFSNRPDLLAYAWTSSGIPHTVRGLLRFDLSMIPTNATVQLATLTLYNDPLSLGGTAHSSLSGSNISWLRKVTTPWNENDVTWNTQPGTTTINQVVLPQSTSPNQDYSLAVTALVQDMVTNPSGNYGFQLRLQTEAYYRSLLFGSSDNSDPANWPKISIDFTLNSAFAGIAAPYGKSICSGTPALLQAITGTGLSYQWRLNGNTLGGATNATYAAAAAGNYDCIISGPCGSATSNLISIISENPPTATITPAGTVQICSGSVSVNANSGSGLTYQWSPGYGFIQGATSSSYSISTPGNYFVMVSNGCGSAVSNTITAVSAAPPNASITSNPSNGYICPGSNILLSAATAQGQTYQWRLNGNPIGGATSSSYSTNVTGSYDCLVTNSCGTIQSNGISVTNSPTPVITAFGPTTFCTGGSVYLQANLVTYSVSWYLNGNPIAGATSNTYSATSPGQYSYASLGACTTMSNVINVVVETQPLATITAGGITTFCLGGSVVLNAPTATGLNYQWRKNTTGIPGATSYSFLANSSGTYDCLIANTCGTTVTNSILVTVNTVPSVAGAITGQSSGVCSSTKTFSIAAIVGATSYNWTVPAGSTVSSGQGTASVNITFTSSFTSGSVTVSGMNSCGNGTSSSLTVAGVPALPGTITGPASVCHNQNNINYSIAAITGATSYTWTVPPGASIKTGQGTSQIKVRFGNSAGNVTVKANNACGSGSVRSLAVAMPCRDAEETFDDNYFDVSVYPNPVQDQLNVQFASSTTSQLIIRLSDIAGRIVKESTLVSSVGDNLVAFDLTGIPAGSYVLLVGANDQMKMIKVIKQ